MAERPFNALRSLHIRPHVLEHPQGSALVVWGHTQVLCSASVEEHLPRFLLGKNRGWVTAEYDMLPGSTSTRRPRDAYKGKINGRSQEISRLIGRSLRAAVNLTALGERSIIIDCDVLQADGGTRTAAITGGFVALALAIHKLGRRGEVAVEQVLCHQVAAVSVGLIANDIYLDLDYDLDSRADVDMNIVMSHNHQLIEIQGCAEQQHFSRSTLQQFLDLAFACLPELLSAQQQALEQPYTQQSLTGV